MRQIVEEVETLLHERQGEGFANSTGGTGRPQGDVFLYCWRGGMRSAAVAWLLGIYGYSVVLLAGGYKAYRNYVLEVLGRPHPLRVIGGFTGSGKTEVLHKLSEEGARVIDLEGIAGHKGSAFGNIGLPPQPKQEMFENLLAMELSRPASLPLWIEDESQRIGLVNIPTPFWHTLRSAPISFLDIPFEERLEHITAEYGQCEKDALGEAIQRISKRLGPLDTKNAFQFLHEDNYKECFRILLRYYDKHYLKGLHKRDELQSLLTNFACATVTPDNAILLLNLQPA
jgi:tRNA 2-selenouridine synthase